MSILILRCNACRLPAVAMLYGGKCERCADIPAWSPARAEADANLASIAHMPAEEALYLGASFAHIAAYREHQRMARIARSNREALRMHERRTGGRAFR